MLMRGVAGRRVPAARRPPSLHSAPTLPAPRAQGWEELTDAHMTYLLRTSLGKQGGAQGGGASAAAQQGQQLRLPEDTVKLKKHITIVCDRLSKGARLVQPAQQQQGRPLKGAAVVRGGAGAGGAASAPPASQGIGGGGPRSRAPGRPAGGGGGGGGGAGREAAARDDSAANPGEGAD